MDQTAATHRSNIFFIEGVCVRIQDVLTSIVEMPFSDIHLRVGRHPALRTYGQVAVLGDLPEVTQEAMDSFREEFTNAIEKEYWQKNGDTDCALSYGGMRLRAAFFKSDTGDSLCMRRISESIPSLEQLNAPKSLYKAADFHSGMVLVTGPTGSGKSSTLAAIVNHINENNQYHILTLEDPIEFRHPSKKSVVSQRQVGRDAKSFATALKAALREDPDVILIGELRDPESISLALSAAETGHLVLGTLHTRSAIGTIGRIVDTMPAEAQNSVRAQLAESLKMVISQQLLLRIDGKGRAAAHEVMMTSTPIANLIREGRLAQVESYIQAGRSEGMQTMEQAVAVLKAQRLVAP